MAVGFRIYNDNNVIQITDELPNFALKYKGTSTPAAGPRYPYESSIRADGVYNPLIAVEPANTTQVVCLIRSFQIDTDSFNWNFACSTAGSFTYYIFDNYSNAIAAAETAGVRVYKQGTSDIAWSTAEYPLRIVGGGTNTTTLPSGRVYAAIQTEIGHQVTSSGTAPEVFYAYSVNKYFKGVRRQNATSLNSANYNYLNYLTNTPPGTYGSGSPVLLYVDVTNLTAPAGLVGSGDPADIVTAANWANISTSGFSSSTSATISDIGTTIEMSVIASNADITTTVRVNSTIVDNPITVAPDDIVLIEVDNTSSTTETDSIVVRNITSGNAIVDTISVSLGGLYDFVPNAINWGNISPGSYIGTNTAQTVSGIGGSISISWTDTASNVTVLGRVNGGAWQSSPVTVTNGQTVQFRAENFAAVSRSGTVTVKNNTDPTKPTLDTFSVSLTAAP